MDCQTKSWKELDKSEKNVSVPLIIEARMSGVTMASQYNTGEITLTYEDGTTEKAPCKDVELHEVESFFGIVSLVQDRARGGK